MACGCSCTFSGTLCWHLDFLWFHTTGFFLGRIARQLIDHKGLRAQIALQREAITVGVEGELTGEVAVAYQGLEVLEGPCGTVVQQATLKAVGWQRRDGEGQEGREPSGVCPLHGKLDRQISTLWPLAEGPVHPGARVPQAELHLHRGGLLSAAPCSNASIKVEWLAVHPTLAGQTQA